MTEKRSIRLSGSGPVYEVLVVGEETIIDVYR